MICFGYKMDGKLSVSDSHQGTYKVWKLVAPTPELTTLMGPIYIKIVLNKKYFSFTGSVLLNNI